MIAKCQIEISNNVWHIYVHWLKNPKLYKKLRLFDPDISNRGITHNKQPWKLAGIYHKQTQLSFHNNEFFAWSIGKIDTSLSRTLCSAIKNAIFSWKRWAVRLTWYTGASHSTSPNPAGILLCTVSLSHKFQGYATGSGPIIRSPMCKYSNFVRHG